LLGGPATSDAVPRRLSVSLRVAGFGRKRNRPDGAISEAEGLVCRPGSVPGRLATHRSATIHLGPPLPTTSCGPPAHSGGHPSSVRCSTLLRAGFTEPIRSPGSLVVSCTTVSPLPKATASGGLFSVALSRGLPRVGVAHRPALRSPDLPRHLVIPAHTCQVPRPPDQPLRAGHRRARVTWLVGHFGGGVATECVLCGIFGGDNPA